MNRKADTPLNRQPAQRGEIARKLLQAAKRSQRSTLPALPLVCDANQTMASETARVLGPYPNGQKWRLVVKEGKGRKSLVFDTREQAESVRGNLLIALDDRACRSIGDTIDEYLTFKRKRGCGERTIRTVRDKLIPFLPVGQTLRSITPDLAERLYAAQTEKVAVATHHKNLRDAKAFFRYCVRQKYLTVNPFADVQAIGKANAGKPQLRTDEARKLSDFLVSEATDGDPYALALMVQVLLGLRSGEVLKLRKRDLDCGGKVLVIEGTKTKNAKRTLELDAPVVRDLLLRRCEGLTADGLIFMSERSSAEIAVPTLWKKLGTYCRRAGVPSVCPHSLRGLHSTLAVKAGATSTYVAQALGHGSDAVTRRHYIAPSALDDARSSRVAGALLGETDLDGLISTLRNLPSEQLDRVCSTLGLRR